MNADKKSKFRYFAFLIYKYDKDGNRTYSDEHEIAKTLGKTWGDFLISPLHEPDDEIDCEHWHIIYRHGNPITLEAARNLIGEFAYNGFILCLHHPRNYQRYLLHLDNPDKQQFTGDQADNLIVVNNFPVDLTKELSKTEKFEIQMDIEVLITEHNITEYKTVCDYLREKSDFDHYIYFTTHTHHFSAYINSYRNKMKETIENEA